MRWRKRSIFASIIANGPKGILSWYDYIAFFCKRVWYNIALDFQKVQHCKLLHVNNMRCWWKMWIKFGVDLNMICIFFILVFVCFVFVFVLFLFLFVCVCLFVCLFVFFLFVVLVLFVVIVLFLLIVFVFIFVFVFVFVCFVLFFKRKNIPFTQSYQF